MRQTSSGQSAVFAATIAVILLVIAMAVFAVACDDGDDSVSRSEFDVLRSEFVALENEVDAVAASTDEELRAVWEDEFRTLRIEEGETVGEALESAFVTPSELT
jgi:hypothetical protein